jgi:L-alanine-DL-glutamate epimerase-like enolase superfamily enzyme
MSEPASVRALENLPVPKIERADLVTVRLPFVAPFGTSVYTWTDKEAMLLRLEGDGATAWSECVSDPDPY